MNTSKLKKFAQHARRNLIEQVSNKLDLVLSQESPERREHPQAVKKLEVQIQAHGEEQVIEKVAYIWFNRFCALRFMDVNRYTRIGVVSPAEGQFQPEILAEAKMGHIDEGMVDELARQRIFALLDGKTPSQDPQAEAYRLLVVAICNYWHGSMPFMFERITDFTELLMPDDLLSGNSILAYTREAMTPDVCEDVEVIGWLYQFYISEKKDEVFEGLKKNKKITPENIPAATQLFTPHWIVRYLVENSLGRLWMLNRPDSRLVEQMDYYIKPEQAESGFLRISSPEEIKICDPACGSGHMLTYAFDLLYTICEEEGYEPAEIPEKILTKNLYGIEIDERAGELAAFALTMKARAKQRRFFRKQVQPNICVLENIQFGEDELKEYMDFIGRDLFTAPLQTTLRQFEEADNFGSLIRPDLTNIEEIVRVLEAKDVSGQLFLKATHDKVLKILRQANYLSPKYHVVIANPPYMGGKGMNGRLKAWAGKNYPDSKSDLFAMFMERALEISIPIGMMAVINMQSWMFLSSFEKLRNKLLGNATLLSMAHLGERGFDTIGGAVVSTTAFVFANGHHPNHRGAYLRLVDGGNEAEKAEMVREAIRNPDCGWFYCASAKDFSKIPGSPLTYWVGDCWFQVFSDSVPIGEVSYASEGIKTGNNEKYLRHWFEVAYLDVGPLSENNFKWVYHIKGGEFRRWSGNEEYVILWQNNGEQIRIQGNSGIQGERSFPRNSAIWSDITTGGYSARLKAANHLFDSSSPSGFIVEDDEQYDLLAFLNSKIVSEITPMLNPTLHFKVGNFRSLPYRKITNPDVVGLIKSSKSDWNAFETSWDFASLPLLNPDYRQTTLKATYQKLRAHWQAMTLEMQRLEEENNRIFIDAYGLQDELT
ncbi:BREX-1 system adenine-specific DNA-methyltransferase PglX, partial [Thiolapillus sp.]